MTSERNKEIQEAIINAVGFFPIDFSAPYQSMSFVGLKEMRRDIPLPEFIQALKTMEGVILDTDAHQVRIPTGYFEK